MDRSLAAGEPSSDEPMRATVVELEYEALARGDDLTDKIEKAFGVEGYGILSVSGVPGINEVRSALLPCAHKFSSLPAEVRAAYEDPSAFYSRGWSHGREKLQGRPDHSKGSYYANPLHNSPFDDADIIARFPTFCAPNVWPTKELPELEGAFMRAGQLMNSVGGMVAAQCDRFVRSRLPSYPADRLASVLRQSRCCTGRLLHYFPRQQGIAANADEPSATGAAASSEEFASWCGWHNDHSSLTALLPGMYFDEAGQQVDAPDASAGLYVRSRQGALVQPCIPSTHLGFQIGETAQILSGGLLQATPHAVKGANVAGVSRATFAIFMGPEFDFPMAVPDGIEPSCTQSTAAAAMLPKGVPPLASRWGSEECPFTTCKFADFATATFSKYH